MFIHKYLVALITKHEGGHHPKICEWNHFHHFIRNVIHNINKYMFFILVIHTFFAAVVESVLTICFSVRLFFSFLSSSLSSSSSVLYVYSIYIHVYVYKYIYKMVVIAYKKMCHFWQFCWRFITIWRMNSWGGS